MGRERSGDGDEGGGWGDGWGGGDGRRRSGSREIKPCAREGEGGGGVVWRRRPSAAETQCLQAPKGEGKPQRGRVRGMRLALRCRR